LSNHATFPGFLQKTIFVRYLAYENDLDVLKKKVVGVDPMSQMFESSKQAKNPIIHDYSNKNIWWP
jgi:hypothetical protein